MKNASIAIALLALSLFALQVVAQPKAKATHSSATNTSSQASTMPMPMAIVAPLFIEGKQFRSTVTAVNDGLKSTKITLTLHDESGATLASVEQDLPGHSEHSFQLRDLLHLQRAKENKEPDGDKQIIGSVEIMPELATVAAQLSLTYNDGDSSLQIEEEFSMPNPTATAVFRGVAAAATASPFIALKNTSQRSLSIDVQCVPESGTATSLQVELGALRLLVLQPCQTFSKAKEPNFEAPASTSANIEGKGGKELGAVGVSISADGTEEDLAVYGFAWSRFDNSKKLSSLFFVTPDDLNSSQTAYVGIAAGKTDLLGGKTYASDLAITNFSQAEASVFIKAAISSNTGTPNAANQTITMPPMSSKTTSIAITEPDPNLQNSVLVESSLAPGLVVTKLTSHASGKAPILEYQPKDTQQKQNSGLHPWSLKAGSDSRLLLFNYTPQEQYFNVKVYAADVAWQHAWLLKPLETRSISFKELIKEQVPDGRSFPQLPNQAKSSGQTQDATRVSAECSSATLAGVLRVTSVAGSVWSCVKRQLTQTRLPSLLMA
jgi:hypothetical protein